MEIIGLTGGIGCGKSSVCRYLKDKYNAEIIMADNVAHEVAEFGTACNKELHELFPDDNFQDNGNMNRKKIGDQFFKNPDMLNKINAIIHPAVDKEILSRLEAAKAEGRSMAVIEAALLVGTKYEEICAEFWYVYADREVRVQRLLKSRDITREKALNIMANQISDEEYKACSSFIADNSKDFDATAGQIDVYIAKRFSL